MILENDPAFKPIVLKSSFGAKEINNNAVHVSSDDEDDDETASTSSTRSSTPTTNSKGKKRKVDELKDYFSERDKEFFKKLNEMQEKTNSILEKLVDKL
jgi:hypothetical protein